MSLGAVGKKICRFEKDDEKSAKNGELRLNSIVACNHAPYDGGAEGGTV